MLTYLLWPVCILMGLYCLGILCLLAAWSRIPKADFYQAESTKTALPFVSVVVAVRNEEKNILRLLESLFVQNFENNNWELVVVDDHSVDSTWALLQQQSKPPISLRVFKQRLGLQGKKAALSLGIQEARGEIILTTDGDCILPKTWLCTMSKPFLAKSIRPPDLVSAPVCFITNDTLLSKLLAVEFASLIGTGAAAMFLKVPFICNGANLAFLKSTFVAVNGYEGNAHVASGDDEFLLRKIKKLPNSQILFLKDRAALAYTKPPGSWSEFVQQRLRWASKWRLGNDLTTMSLAVFIFLVHLSRIGLLILLFQDENIYCIASALLFQLLLDNAFVGNVLSFFGQKRLWYYLPMVWLAYSFYTIFFGILANKNTYEWKDRVHS